MEKKAMSNVDDTFIPNEFYFYIRPYIPEKFRREDGREEAGNTERSTQENLYHTIYGYEAVTKNFEAVMLSLLTYVRQVGSAAENTSSVNRAELYNVLRSVIDESCSKKKGKIAELVLGFQKGKGCDTPPEERVYSIYNSETAQRIRQLRESCDAAPRILCESVLQQIVNTWETLLGNLIHVRYMNNPELLTEPQPISFAQVIHSRTPQDLQTIFVDKVVSEIIGQDTIGQLKSFKDDFKADLRQVFPRMEELKEIVWRRHMIVHCDGRATIDYCKNIKNSAQRQIRAGERIETDLRYIYNAWDVVFAAGMEMSHLVSVSFARSSKLVDMEEPADNFLLVASFNALKEKRYHAAKLILEYATGNNCHIGTEEAEWALKVNQALVYKALHDDDGFRKIVWSDTWDKRREHFRAPIAVLRGNYKEAYKLIRGLCKEDPDYINQVYEWVVYEDLRNDEDFESEMARIKSSRSFSPQAGVPPILDLTAKPADVKKYLKELFASALKVPKVVVKTRSNKKAR